MPIRPFFPRILPGLLLGLPLPAAALTSHSSPIAADETWIGATYYGVYSWSTVADITIAQNAITANRGILVRNDALVIGNTITDAIDWAIYLYASGGLIRDNTTYGIRNGSGVTISAENCWWDSDTGP